MPPAPPPTEADTRAAEQISRQLDEIAAAVERRCLEDAVRVAQAVAAGQLPDLKAHFLELGRRFRGELTPAPKGRRSLRMIDGGLT
jgi:hypothetical protein